MCCAAFVAGTPQWSATRPTPAMTPHWRLASRRRRRRSCWPTGDVSTWREGKVQFGPIWLLWDRDLKLIAWVDASEPEILVSSPAAAMLNARHSFGQGSNPKPVLILRANAKMSCLRFFASSLFLFSLQGIFIRPQAPATPQQAHRAVFPGVRPSADSPKCVNPFSWSHVLPITLRFVSELLPWLFRAVSSSLRWVGVSEHSLTWSLWAGEQPVPRTISWHPPCTSPNA